MRVCVYCGGGASDDSLRALKILYPDALFLKADDVKQGKWRDKADLFIMPGGRDIPYDRALRGKGNQQIRGFVERGGKYLGICAGAYYGAKKVEFELGTALEVNEERELAFYPGKAVGTLFSGFMYETEEGAHLVEVGDDTFYYNGGCGFPNAENISKIEIKQRFKKNNIPVIIGIEVEKGYVVLSGVHVEYGSAKNGWVIKTHQKDLLSKEPSSSTAQKLATKNIRDFFSPH